MPIRKEISKRHMIEVNGMHLTKGNVNDGMQVSEHYRHILGVKLQKSLNKFRSWTAKATLIEYDPKCGDNLLCFFARVQDMTVDVIEECKRVLLESNSLIRRYRV